MKNSPETDCHVLFKIWSMWAVLQCCHPSIPRHKRCVSWMWTETSCHAACIPSHLETNFERVLMFSAASSLTCLLWAQSQATWKKDMSMNCKQHEKKSEHELQPLSTLLIWLNAMKQNLLEKHNWQRTSSSVLNRDKHCSQTKEKDSASKTCQWLENWHLDVIKPSVKRMIIMPWMPQRLNSFVSLSQPRVDVLTKWRGEFFF